MIIKSRPLKSALQAMSPDKNQGQVRMLPGKGNWLPVAEAAAKANTQVSYIHRLLRQKKNGIRGDYELRGKLKYWYVDPTCPRYEKLLNRNNLDETTQQALQAGSIPIDMLAWEDMCIAGEEIVKHRCSAQTIREYRRNIQSFFKRYRELTRDTLRAALRAFESRMTIERDFYTSRRMLYQALMTVARFYVYLGEKDQEFIKGLSMLRPKRGRRIVSRPCYTEADVMKAMDVLDSAVNKKGAKAYRYYDVALNRLLIALMFFTGARSGELCKMRIADIDYMASSIRLFGKGGKERYVGICKALRAELKQYWSQRPKTRSIYFLVSHKGQPLRPTYLSGRMRRLRKYAEIPKLAPHAVRRTSITWQLNVKKVPMPIVRDAVGHSSLSVTNLYAQPTANDVINTMKDF